MRNPYIPVEVDNPSLAQIRQKQLVGEGLAERREIEKDVQRLFRRMMDDGYQVEFDDGEDAKKMKRYYQRLCENILQERKRIGGDWAVASAAMLDRDWRQYVR